MYIKRKKTKGDGGRVVTEKNKKNRSMKVTPSNVKTTQPRVGNKNLGAHKRGNTASGTAYGETEIQPEGQVQESEANNANTTATTEIESGGEVHGNLNGDQDEEDEQRRRPRRHGKEVLSSATKLLKKIKKKVSSKQTTSVAEQQGFCNELEKVICICKSVSANKKAMKRTRQEPGGPSGGGNASDNNAELEGGSGGKEEHGARKRGRGGGKRGRRGGGS
ncbi:uncharacterized protein LOC113346781 [Papaver somniferum]|uniref:uncharacterized protein LOC113346781 n=1 Tax=Papaver somniferum TaxID=3469 RepID=UPI000E6F590C|nr:uncharacterized protein LOC113346781 [Papaver somniferum]